MTTIDKETQIQKVARCEDCGFILRNIPWREGFRCPRCRSTKFLPVPVSGAAVDYALADRSKGYAIEDIRFAKLALWSGLISSTQYQEAFNEQNEFVAAKASPPPIGQILEKRKALRKIESDAIIQYRILERPSPDDAEFARLALQAKYTTEDRIQECLERMDQDKKLGREPAPLACLLYEKRYLQENQVLALVQKQLAKGGGLAAAIRKQVQKNDVRFLDKTLGPKGSPRRALRMAMLGVLGVILVAYLSTFLFSSASIRVATRCHNCGVRSAMAYDTPWPAKCPECSATVPSVYPLAVCMRCGELHDVMDGELPAKCSRCGANTVKWLTAGIDDEQIRQKAAKLNYR